MPSILWTLAFALGVLASAAAADEAGDVAAGQRAFRACVACHSLEAGRHMTGPSLARLWGRKAGTAEGFPRYSPALKSANVVWTDETLDAWLADPRALVPRNTMIFRGIKDAKVRADLIAYLKLAAAEASPGQSAQGGGRGRGPQMRDLKTVGPAHQVSAIRYCDETYRVTTAAGELPPFWENNLRFKSDSSATGPAKGRPAIMQAGMMGDRASVIFADPAEISAFIEKRC